MNSDRSFAADRPERGGQLTGDHPYRVSVTLRQLWQGLQMLVGEQLGVRVAVVDGAEHRADSLRLAFRPQDGTLLLTFGPQDPDGLADEDEDEDDGDQADDEPGDSHGYSRG